MEQRLQRLEQLDLEELFQKPLSCVGKINIFHLLSPIPAKTAGQALTGEKDENASLHFIILPTTK